MQRLSISFLFYFLLCLFVPNVFAQGNFYDVIIRDAEVFDGLQFYPKGTDVGIKKDKIDFIGDLSEGIAEIQIDGRGLILSPGFIDTHTHSDLNPFIYQNMNHKVAQGVTTEVVGNCGMSGAPIGGYMREKFIETWGREGVELGSVPQWQSFGDYLEGLEKTDLDNNVAALVGHGNIRTMVMGYKPAKASLTELEDMRMYVRRSMQEGAIGISFGLGYLPGMFADTYELTELCKVAARLNGICSFHIRSEGSKLIEALHEAIDIGERAQARIQISHLKAGGKNNWQKIDAAFDLIRRKRLDGVRVAADMYPYTAGYAELAVMLPNEIYQMDNRLEYFKDLLKRQELLKRLRDYDNQSYFSWGRVRIAATKSEYYWPYEGLSFKEIARREQIEPEKFLIDILADNAFNVSAFYFSQTEEVVRKVVQEPYVMIGSDSIADGTRRPHPRAYGTFPRIISEYVNRERLITLEDSLRKMTALPAEHFQLLNRGRIDVGYFADLVLFHQTDIADQSTYEKPKERPEGIRWVFVNGKPVVSEERLTEVQNGAVITSQTG